MDSSKNNPSIDPIIPSDNRSKDPSNDQSIDQLVDQGKSDSIDENICGICKSGGDQVKILNSKDRCLIRWLRKPWAVATARSPPQGLGAMVTITF